MNQRPCPVCRTAMLTAPGQCPSCGPIRLFEVRQPRVIHATYTRQIWSTSTDRAISEAECGTAWPQSYDESRESVECGEFTAKDVTDTGYMRMGGGFEDPEVAAFAEDFLSRPAQDDDV